MVEWIYDRLFVPQEVEENSSGGRAGFMEDEGCVGVIVRVIGVGRTRAYRLSDKGLKVYEKFLLKVH